MKSKISIWDCRRAIEIKGGLPLAVLIGCWYVYTYRATIQA